MNVSDERCPMSGIIEATRLAPMSAPGGDTLVCIPQYIDHRDPFSTDLGHEGAGRMLAGHRLAAAA